MRLFLRESARLVRRSRLHWPRLGEGPGQRCLGSGLEVLLAWALGGLTPKLRCDAKLVDGRDQHADVVAQELAVKLVDLRRLVLRLHGPAKLCLDHRKYRLDVGSLMVVRQEVLALVLEVVEQLAPQVVLASHRTRLERDVRNGSGIDRGLEILFGRVRLVSRNLVHVEAGDGRVQQRLEHGGVTGIGHDQVGNDVGKGAAHRVGLHKLRALLVAAPLVVVVPFVDLGGKSGGVSREVTLHALERRGALLQQQPQQRRQGRVVHVPEQGVVVGLGEQQPLLVTGIQGAGRTAPALAGVDLVDVAEHHVTERRLGSAHALLGNLDAVAEQPEHPDEVDVLGRLGFVVGRPILRVLRGLVYHERASGEHEATATDLDGEDVLAEGRPLLVVGAGAGWLVARVVHDPGAQAGLRLDVPAVASASLDLSLAGNLGSLVLSGLHRLPNYTPMKGTVKEVGWKGLLVASNRLETASTAALAQVGQAVLGAPAADHEAEFLGLLDSSVDRGVRQAERSPEVF